MSEEYKGQSHERGHEHSAEAHNASVEKLNELIEQGRHSRHEKAEQIDNIRSEAHQEALSAQETISLQSEHAQNAPAATPLVNKDLKDLKFKRTLQSVRKQESAPERVLSKVVHNKTVDVLSAAAEKTVARPSGLLAGGLCALIGSSVFLYIAKHYGYEYNFLLFVMFFVGGFFLGLLIEAVFKLLRRK